MGRVVATVGIVAGLAAGGAAAAGHTVAVGPRSGDVNSTFSFVGKRWQPTTRVDVSYFVSLPQRKAYRRFHFSAGGNGSFVFKLKKPIGLVDSGVTSRMCFRQRDTRGKRPHVYRACSDFYVAGPSAQFMPSTGKPGDLFLLVASGFLAGRQLEGTWTLPGGRTSDFVVRTRTSDGFVPGGPFGPIFVRRGGAAIRFPSAATDSLGLYSVLLTDPRAGSRARAAVLLSQ